MSDTDESHSVNEKYAKYTGKHTYYSYLLLLAITCSVIIIGILFDSYEDIIIAVPVAFVLADAIYTDKMVSHIPPMMIYILVGLMIVMLISEMFDEHPIMAYVINVLLGSVLGLAGIITTYVLKRTTPGVHDEQPILIAFVSMSIAITMFMIITTLLYLAGIVTSHAFMESDALMNNFISMAVGAGIVSLIFYLNKHNSLFKNTVDTFLASHAGTMNLDEYETMMIQNAINSGENERVEYKSTLRTNLSTGEKDPRMEKAVLKTLVAFMNTDGGTLLIGVSDDGAVCGIDESSFDNKDKLNLHMTNLIASQIGNEFLDYISFRLIQFDDKSVMRVVCRSSDSPVFLRENKQETFFVRSGPSSIELHGTDLLNYATTHFKLKNKKNKR